MASTDDLSLLMPCIRQRALSSAGDTNAVREYLRGARNPAAPLHGPSTTFRDLLKRKGKLRSAQERPARSLDLKLRPVVVAGSGRPAAVADSCNTAGGGIDVERLKDHLLETHLHSRRTYLASKLRTGQARSRRQLAIQLKPVVLRPSPQPEPEPELDGQGLENELAAGALSEPQTAVKPTPQQQLPQACRTPGTALLGQTPMEGVPERWLVVQQSCSKTPGASSVLGRTPLEGVPERWTAPRAPAPPKPATPRLLTPIEGVPEGRTALVVRKPPAIRIGEQAQQSVDSPIEGVVQQAAHGRSGGRPAAAADFTFASPLPPSPPQQPGAAEQPAEAGLQGLQQHAGAMPPAAPGGSDDELDDGGFDYGGNSEPSVLSGNASPARPLYFTDAAVQTGASLGRQAARLSSPADMRGDAEPAGPSLQDQQGEEAAGMEDVGGQDYYDDDDYDAGGLDYDDSDQEAVPLRQEGPAEEGAHAGPLEPPPMSAQRPAQQQRRRNTNHGVRLRNELKRKSLGSNPGVGLREVAPGVRRSTRQKQVPLDWWRGETKHFSRQEHKTMPTVKEVVQKTPNTPWRMVSDIYGHRKARRRNQQREREAEEEEEAGRDMQVD